MVNTTVKEVTNPVAGQDADHAGGTDWNQLVQVVKGTHATERHQMSSIQHDVWVTKTAVAVTLAVTEVHILVDATANVVALTLPTAVANLSGRHIIKRVDATWNLVTIVGTAAQTIDGKATYYLTGRDEVIEMTSDGANWKISGTKENVTEDSFRARGAVLNRNYSYPLTANTATITATVVAATAYAFPIVIPRTVTIDLVQINVVAIGAGSSVYGAIYFDNGNLYPGKLCVDFGGVATAVGTGAKTLPNGCPFTLTPGLYWLVFDCSATAPTVSGFAAAQIYPMLGISTTFTAAQGIGWTVALAAGAFPDPFTAGGTVIIAVPCPAIWLRVSG